MSARWFDEVSVAKGAAARFDVGPTTVWLARSEAEWRIAYVTRADPGELREAVRCPAPDDAPDGEATSVRCAVGVSEGRIRLVPRAADRPVVVRPDVPFRLLPHVTTTLYVSTPLWIEVSSGTVLYDLPSFRPSDTWFGPDTTHGDLCYASRTQARVDLDGLVVHPARAVTALTLKNEGDQALLVERINLPARNLSVFVADDGRLWTETVHVDKEGPGVPPTTRIGAEPAKEAGEVRRIGEPREVEQPNAVLRAFSAFIG